MIGPLSERSVSCFSVIFKKSVLLAVSIGYRSPEAARAIDICPHLDAGYHVTEVKAGHFSALDCGANPEAWSEIFVQLWDIDEGERTHMTAGKFSAIVRKVSEHVRLDGSAKLTFEVSDGVRPMQLFCANNPVAEDGVLHVELTARPASCKPRDRWLAEQATRESFCCSSSTASKCCA